MSNEYFSKDSVFAKKAEYIDQGLPEYNDNLLIKALPPIMSPVEVEAKLQHFPIYKDSERFLDAHLRFHIIDRLYDFFQPMDKHFEIESKISRAIRRGYLSRNPASPANVTALHEIRKAIDDKDSSLSKVRPVTVPASGFAIIGYSGVGKTTTVEKILSWYPQVILHEMKVNSVFNDFQIVWMKLDCPHNGSIKSLCTSFFIEYDRLLGARTHKDFASHSQTTTEVMIPQMTILARRNHLGLLVIDEIQNISSAKSGGSGKMLDFFVSLANRIGVPILLIGTNKALPILRGEFREARRSGGQQGPVFWENLKENEIWWQVLMNGLWKHQWTKKKVPLTPEISRLFFEHSQGIVDVAVKLFAMTQFKAIATGKETITVDIVNQAATEGLLLLKPMLDALKSKDEKKIGMFEDLLPLHYDQFRDRQIASMLNPVTNMHKRKSSASSSIDTILPQQFDPSSGQGIIMGNCYSVTDTLKQVAAEGKRTGSSVFSSLEKAGFIKDIHREFIEAG
ncbi:MAG: AAA family ATPase [Brevinematales bacterium]|nr:AAA family ATPase [Brevinematales bacterium]